MKRPTQSQPDPLKPYELIFEQETAQAEAELQRPAVGLCLSGLVAGFAIGIGVFGATAVLALVDPDQLTGLGAAALRATVASVMALGFIIAVLGRADVFTEYTTITLFPVLVGRSPLGSLLRLWSLVYLSNVAGAVAFGAMAAVLAPALGTFDADAVVRLVEPLIGHDGWVVLLSAGLAGWMMGLLSWLITAGRETISQAFFIWIVPGLIGFTHLHHCISWSVEGTLAVMLGAAGLADVATVLGWTTLGNVGGGVLFAVMTRYSVMRSE